MARYVSSTTVEPNEERKEELFRDQILGDIWGLGKETRDVDTADLVHRKYGRYKDRVTPRMLLM